jgi:hypothetical protein
VPGKLAPDGGTRYPFTHPLAHAQEQELGDTNHPVEANPYAPPAAEVRDIPEGEAAGFYVVSTRKYFLLYFLTLGLYLYYWFYRHWAEIRRQRGVKLWPIPRAIFAIFFTHALAREIDARLDERSPGYKWSPSLIATLLVVLMIATNILDRLAWRELGVPVTIWLSYAVLVPVALTGHVMQRAANAASADPQGSCNARITGANLVWMLVGGALGVLGLIELVIPEAMP